MSEYIRINFKCPDCGRLTIKQVENTHSGDTVIKCGEDQEFAGCNKKYYATYERKFTTTSYAIEDRGVRGI